MGLACVAGVCGWHVACKLRLAREQVPVEKIVTKEVEKIVYVDKPIEIEKIKEVMCEGRSC